MTIIQFDERRKKSWIEPVFQFKTTLLDLSPFCLSVPSVSNPELKLFFLGQSNICIF